MEKRWYSNGEIWMPSVYGICFALALADTERLLGLPLIVGLIGAFGGLVGAGFSIYRFFAKTTKPVPGQ